MRHALLFKSAGRLTKAIKTELAKIKKAAKLEQKNQIMKRQKRPVYLIYTSAEDGIPLLVPLECKYGPFVLP